MNTHQDRHRLTDGVDWVELTRAEVVHLERAGSIVACAGKCESGTYHPVASWSEIGEETARFYTDNLLIVGKAL